ncbi:MAG: ATP-binding protein [Ferruginibacter sp.]
MIIATGIIMMVLIYQRRQVQYVSEKEQLRVAFEKEILGTQIEIQEQTLQHISRELHDNLGQVASLIKINLTTINVANAEQAIAKIENTKNLTRQLITDIKALSVNLNGDRLLQDGLAKALEYEIEQLNRTGQFTANFSLEGLVPEINKDQAIILYRMSQEVLNNIVKHSGAQQIKLAVVTAGNLFTLSFSDDGVGFNVAEKMNGNGAGLRNLHGRAKLINAVLTIVSEPGNGTNIVIELPL